MRRTMLLMATMALTLLVASGVALAVTKIGGPGPNFLKGTNGDDQLLGKGGNDVLYALAGQDNLLGGEGKDWLLTGVSRALGGHKNSAGGPGNDGVTGGLGSDNVLGGKGNDFVYGDEGADNVVGGPGTDFVADGPDREFATDRLFAGDGDDFVGTWNKPAFKDIVSCGSGFDGVFADRKDVIASDCEMVPQTRAGRDRVGRALERSGLFDGLAPFPGE
jgi:Ca2+-binding RTX toxin-like protein